MTPGKSSANVPSPRSDEVSDGLVVDSIASQLRQILARRIATGMLKPGERLDRAAIAREFGVSSAPVRDALQRLEVDQIIETRPRSGTYVATPTIADIHEVCQYRKGIEWVATGLAARVMPRSLLDELRTEVVEALAAADQGDFEPFFASDARLHGEIVAASGNQRLIRARAAVEPYVYWLRILGATGRHRVAGSTRRHLEILDAMITGDIEAAKRAAEVHLDEVEAWTVEDMRASMSAGDPDVVPSPSVDG
ncbi:GntR family transcriptional regulator [Microlunatus soli]|uniref:DNA-binding transcriptional regulator, GntR family n=1 Tax=Microlunatus soli TaxID=630515 RepID=A0A1H1TVD2_9ACTN|nr:GntR family transcriptional regulator [Microlunatus soli]SDS64104.1 DNA-binding transcriptional regulator, GntR family [Microlunatus soli]